MVGKKIFAGILMLVVLTSTSCKKFEQFVESFKTEDFTDLHYGAHASNTMDVYLPEGRTGDTRVVVLIHGGSWYAGDKSEFTDYAKNFRNRGFAVVNINYRLTHTPENIRVADQLDDIRAALNFISLKAEEWKISPDRIALMGASAGAHLAMLYTYSMNSDNKVKTVVSLAGPANLADTRNVNMNFAAVVEWLIGSSFSSNPQAYVLASPIANVKATAKPTLLFHGQKDSVVPVQQSIDLKAKLDLTNIKNKLVVYPNSGHEVVDASTISGFMTEVESWLKENL